MKSEEGKKRLFEAASELEHTVRNYSSTSISFKRVMEMANALRDRAFDIHGVASIGEDEKARMLEIIRETKLLAITQVEAECYLEALQMVEGDLKRVA